jgi:nucleotide-binding universal stress UspA family protein
MFSIIAVMAMVTSLMAPAIMKWTIRHIKPQQEEIDRLRREELNQSSLIANVRRVLLPVRVRDGGSPSQLIEARVLDQISNGGKIALTLMTVSSAEDRAASAAFLDRLEAELFTTENVTKKVVVGDRIGDLILDEAKRDYDLLILGASEGRSDSDVVFNPLVDFLVRMAPCPTLLIQGQRVHEDWTPRRVLVPSNGSLASRRAAEVAFALTDNGDREVTILQVVEEERSNYLLDASGTLLARQKRIAQESVEKLRELGALRGVPALAEVAVGDAPEAVILKTARDRGIDLIVLGTAVAAGSDRLYLGPRVERILSNAPCPVIVVNA